MGEAAEGTKRELTEYTHLEAIRALTGMFNDDSQEMQMRLVLCNLISRNALGFADNEFTDEQCAAAGIKLKRG
jgi:hypothetical protein